MTNAKPRMILCGNYGAGNLGDEAILRALLQKYEKKYAVTVISARPHETERIFGVPAVGRFPGGVGSRFRALFTLTGRRALQKTREAVLACDVFVLGGGTLLTDTPWRSILIWSKQVELALRIGKEVWVKGSGVGPLSGSFAQELARRILKKAAKISVRDLRSLEWTKRLGCHRAHLVKDPVFHLHWEKGKSTLKEWRNTVIFVPRFWTKNSDNLENSFIKFVQYLCQEEGKKVIGVSFERGNKKDQEFLSKIFERAGCGNRTKIWGNYKDELDVIRAIAHADMVVGMRLHSLIFAEIAHTPFVGVSYMEKVAGLGESLKKIDQIINLDDINIDRLKAAYKSSLNAAK